jgi:hypothetical protein
MSTVGRAAAFLAGAWLALWVLGGAIRTVILPRGEPVALTRATFIAMRKLFDLRLKRVESFQARDRVMARYSPISLIVLPGVWVALVLLGFTGVFWGLGVDPLERAFDVSGSSLLTLGYALPDHGVPTYGASFVEATIGLGLVALLISFLPTIYGAFQRRELLVARLAYRAGDPPSPVVLIRRHHILNRLDALDDIWDEWESWFADVEETHTSQPSLVFFRSISHERSWVTAAGVVLDSAALRASTLRLPRNARAELCLRAGFLALRRIGTYYEIPFDPDPPPDGPISVTREEFMDVYEQLAGEGVPVLPDREACWRAFAGWRVNYDAPLLGLAGLTMAPYAPWSSDRSLRPRNPAITRVTRNRRADVARRDQEEP